MYRSSSSVSPWRVKRAGQGRFFGTRRRPGAGLAAARPSSPRISGDTDEFAPQSDDFSNRSGSRLSLGSAADGGPRPASAASWVGLCRAIGIKKAGDANLAEDGVKEVVNGIKMRSRMGGLNL